MLTLKQKIHFKRMNATKEGLKFLLTEAEIQQLLEEAGITYEQWTLMGYHLARYNDSGDYKLGNCRFIPASDNRKEKKFSQKMLEANRRNAKLGLAKLTKEALQEAGRKSFQRKLELGIPLSRKCEPGCTCGRHKNGGWNKGKPWKDWYPGSK